MRTTLPLLTVMVFLMACSPGKELETILKSFLEVHLDKKSKARKFLI